MYKKGFVSTTLALATSLMFVFVLVTALYLNSTEVVNFQIRSDQMQARMAASACAEQALYRIYEATDFTGEGSLDLYEIATCEYKVVGTGGSGRKISTVGVSGGSYQRLELNVSKVDPEIDITVWKETVEYIEE